jgi:hypothetical protein
VGGGSSPLSCAFLLPPSLSQAFLLLITGRCCCSCQLPFVYSSSGKWVFHPLLWSFPPSATLTSFPAPGCWACATPTPTRGSPAHLACLFTVLGRIPFPQSLAFSVPHPLSCVSYLFLLLITQFLFFFPEWRSVCPGGYAALAHACL